MASRRLAISSLLCNDDQVPDPVILAPHLRHPSQSSSSSFPHHAPSPSTTPTFQSPSQMPQLHRPSSSRHRLSSPSSSYPIPSPASGPPHQFPSPTMPSKLPSFGLEALVQAATEERRRLSGSSPAEPEIQRCPSPPVEQRHIHPLHHQPPTFRQHKPPEEHVRSPTQHHSPILSPVQMRSPSQPILSPVQLIRSPVYSPITQHHPQSRHRPQDRHRDDPQVRLSAPEDLQYRSPQSAYFSPPMQPRHQMVLDHRAQQQHELERQRLHHEQLLLQEQHHLQQQQKYARERQAPYSERQILPPPPPHTTRGPSMPLHVEPSSHHHPQPLPRPSLMTQPHPTGRKSDPGQHHQLLHPDPVPPPLSAPSFSQAMPTGETALHLNKKRRYSDSPAQVMPIDEKDRIHPEREKAAVGDLGYGRAEPAAHPWPRQPGSGYSHGRKHLALVELMTPNHEAQRSQSAISGVSIDTSRREGLPEVSSSEDSARERASCEVGPHPRGSREESLHAGIVREGHRPSGIHDGALHEGDPREGGSRDKSGSVIHHRRRSPPGSQSGRAIAAKKTEEVEQSLPDLLARAPEPTRLPNKERKSPLPEKDDEGTSLGPKVTPPEGVMGSAEKESRPVLSNKEAKTTIYEEKETRKRPPSRASIDCTPVVEPAPPKKQRTTHLPAASVPKAAEEDAHEWFLEHFDDYNVPVQSQPPRPPTPPPATVPSVHRSKTRTPTPTSMPDAADELEQELEELLADPPISKIEPDADMDVDLVVTELVAETLDADDAKTEDVGMEVDVEDELLSLLDDQPSTRRPPAKSATPGPSNAKLTLPTAATGARHISPPVIPVISVPSPATLLSPAARPSSTRPTSERGSMPPPALVTPGRVKDKEEKSMERSVSATTAPATKKKDALSKSGAKSKATAAVSAGTTTTKSRAKPGPKPKPKPSDASPLTGVKSRAATGPKKPAASRSRSTSVMPSGSAGPEGSEAKAEKQEEEEESEREEDKLYCVCKTTYDEDRFMIACDRCDDWYHTQCVNMPDLEVDLVDQFICPPCVAKHPHLNLKTTYKARCLYGLRHSDPSSPKACHRPARGAFSKYCSDECGVLYMQSRADVWAKKGGKKEKLWETVKEAEKREGVAVCAGEINGTKTIFDKDEGDQVFKLKKSKVEREVERLNGLLDSVVRLREDIKKEMESVLWREKLLELATVRAEQLGECGWDQRLCFGDDECANLGAGALASYNTNVQDGEVGGSSGDWWCSGKKACDRHTGWQAVRVKDVSKEKEKKNDALSNLTTREREIRKRIEDILDPHGHNCNDASGKSPPKASNAKLSNGHTKGKINGDMTTKKGKKRKAPS